MGTSFKTIHDKMLPRHDDDDTAKRRTRVVRVWSRLACQGYSLAARVYCVGFRFAGQIRPNRQHLFSSQKLPATVRSHRTSADSGSGFGAQPDPPQLRSKESFRDTEKSRPR